MPDPYAPGADDDRGDAAAVVLALRACDLEPARALASANLSDRFLLRLVVDVQ